MRAILQRANNVDRTGAQLLNAFSDTQIDENPEGWADAAVPIVEHLLDEDKEDLIKEELTVPGDAEAYVQVMVRLAQKPTSKTYAPYFRPAAGLEEIVATFKQIAENKKFTADHADTIGLLNEVHTEGQWQWQPLVNELDGRLDTGTNPEEEELYGCLRAALILAELHDFDAAESSLGDDKEGRTNICHHLERHKVDLEIASLCTLALLLYYPDLSKKGHVNKGGNARKGRSFYWNKLIAEPKAYDEIIDGVVEVAAELDSVGDLVSSAGGVPKAHDLVDHIVREVASRNDAAEHLDVDVVLDHPERVVTALQEEEEKFDVLLDDLIENQSLASRLESVDKSTWMDELSMDAGLADVVARLQQGAHNLELSFNFLDALRVHTQEVREANRSPDEQEENWPYLLSALKPQARKTLFQYVRDDLINQPEKRVAPVIQLYNGELIQSGVLSDESKVDDLFNHLLPKILKRADIDELEWIADALTHDQGVMKNVSENVLASFQDRLSSQYDQYEEQEDEIRGKLRQIAEAGEFELPEPSDASEKDKDDQSANA